MAYTRLVCNIKKRAVAFFVDKNYEQAHQYYFAGQDHLRARLKQEAPENAERDLAITAEWNR